MAKSNHNTITKRGTQKQRVRTHDQYLVDRFPHLFGYTTPQVVEVGKGQYKVTEVESDRVAEELAPQEPTV